MTNVLEMLEKSAANRPSALAFSDPASEITYADLLLKSKALGSYFLRNSLRSGDCVAFFMEKCVDVMPLMFGTVYANAFYSFIDIRQPAERFTSILETLSPACIVTDEAHFEGLSEALPEGLAKKVRRVDRLLEKAATEPVDEALLKRARARFSDLQPLYVNFTSGSTGTPKGVVIAHRSVVDFITEFDKTFGITAEDVFANQAPFDFDVSVKDIYGAMYAGAQVALIPREYFTDPTTLMDYICDKGASVLVWAVSAMCFVSIMNGLSYRVPEGVRLVMFSGEVMPVKQLLKWQDALPTPRTTYVNLYGPTEITCNCTYHVLERAYEKGEEIPIGVPFANEKVFLLDEEDKPVAEPDRIGEICVSGTCVGLGYYKDPEKTAAAFVQNPLQKRFLETVYRTGDLGKYDKDRLLFYVGRKDFQVKHMGQRIELGDIEAAAMKLDGIERACCLYDHAHQRIVLFYTGPLEKGDVSEQMKDKLPPFMMPNKTIRLNTFPLNKNGKIDRRSLEEHF